MSDLIRDEATGQYVHPADGRLISPGYMPDPDAPAKAAAFPGFVDWTILVVPDPEYVAAPATAEPGGQT